jgi:hypothetical protein
LGEKNVLFLGPFTSGKSAFINMLLGVRILPEQLQSTNVPAVKIHSGRTAGLFIRESGQKYGNPIPSFDDIPSDWSGLEYMELSVPDHPLLEEGLVLWDTPGINTTRAHHSEYLEGFLKRNTDLFRSALFFIPGNLEGSSVEFIKRWPALRPITTLVVNIKQAMAEDDCRKIEAAVKKEAYRRLGPIPVELLYCGDLYEDFVDESMRKEGEYKNYQRIAMWEDLVVDFGALRERHRDRLIGDVIFEVLEDARSAEAEGDGEGDARAPAAAEKQVAGRAHVFCVRCGREIGAGSKFCPYCGRENARFE